MMISHRHSTSPRRPSARIWFTRLVLLIAILALLPALGACSETTGTTDRTTSGTTTNLSTATSSPSGTATTTGTGNPAPSGTLRLFCTTRTTLNPLSDRSSSFISVSRLVYEGLYRIDSNGASVAELAQTATVSADGLTIDITLGEGHLYPTGAAVTASDVVASFNFLRAAGPASAFFGKLPDIASITAVDARKVRIGLTRPQPDFAWQLVFPIVSAAGLTQSAAKPMTILPGSGPYQIVQYKAGTGLTLAVNEKHTGSEKRTVKSILVKEYKDRHAAMRAFERDEIDLIDLLPSEYPVYAIRNGLKLERFWSDEYVFLAFNTQPGALLENVARLTFVKALCQDQRLLDGTDSLGIFPAAVPILPDSHLWSKTPNDDPDYDRLYQSGSSVVPDPKLVYTATRKALVILAPEGDVLRTTLAHRLNLLLTERKIVTEVRILPADGFLAARQSGQYDILLAQAIVPDSMDPRWLIGPAPDGMVAGSELLSRKGLAGYAEASVAVAARFESGTAQAAEAADNAALFRKAVDLAPFAGIGFRYAALCSGNRVLGQVRPQMSNLYEGIEELWIWSTLSS